MAGREKQFAKQIVNKDAGWVACDIAIALAKMDQSRAVL
jgi:hypothetical protein